MLGELVEVENRAPLKAALPDLTGRQDECQGEDSVSDATPAEHIELIITEQGVYSPWQSFCSGRELWPEPTSAAG